VNNTSDQKEKILEYKEKAQEIIYKMFNVLMRAHRKVDDIEYRKILEKLHQI